VTEIKRISEESSLQQFKKDAERLEAAAMIGRLHSARDSRMTAAPASPSTAGFYGDNKPYLSVFSGSQSAVPTTPALGAADGSELKLPSAASPSPLPTARSSGPPAPAPAASVADLFDLTLDFDPTDCSGIGGRISAALPKAYDSDADKLVDSVRDIDHMRDSCDSSIDMFLAAHP
jgi:hypothetical protein